ncbi:hypothetical protein GIB67_006438 [Kingdonia uniflora]|uniref:Uncharacterized protein n=1 Tax=Kingdonia uniflora TaxID=39325 RepID=A0A7J7NFA3_9MAGN|nr:hypothetical protein GIB67_006438 [Kingdonia uniflora]
MNISALPTGFQISSLQSSSSLTQRKELVIDDVVSSAHLPSHIKFISSPSNPFVKHCLKLRQSSSYRHSHGSVLVVGTTPIK